ncbi:hypothetical protein KSF78_0008309 [Schistosoma japonicum]|nr:hypothetical protein KSF78_0008309 [Schistosoma japonicum]
MSIFWIISFFLLCFHSDNSICFFRIFSPFLLNIFFIFFNFLWRFFLFFFLHLYFFIMNIAFIFQMLSIPPTDVSLKPTYIYDVYDSVTGHKLNTTKMVKKNYHTCVSVTYCLK